MTTRTEPLRLCDVPALLAHPPGPPRGTVLFFHGLGASKETGLKEIDSLAARGHRVVAVDNVGHGERRYPDFDARFSTANPGLEAAFEDAVHATAVEVPRLVDDLIERGLAEPARIGACGISMGGFVVYAAIPLERRIRAAAPILGSPEWKSGDARSPHHHPECFFPTALLSQNAGRDTSVKAAFAAAFHHRLAPHYEEAPARLRFHLYPDSGHFMNEPDWIVLWNRTLDWFDEHL